jgi:hypothetical protein
MKTHRSRFLAMVAFGLLAVSAGANTAAAQNRYDGKFTLPHEVRWQGRVMPAGEYTFSLPSISMPAMLRLDGPNGTAFVPTSGISDAATDKKSCLTIEHRGGARFVSELYLAELGVHLRYSIPKAPKEQLLAQGPSSTESVLIPAAAK